MLRKYSEFDLFNDLFRGLTYTHSDANYYPPTNIIERQGGYDIQMFVPGFSKSDIKISAKPESLRISAEKKLSEDKALHREYSLSGFERTFSLPRKVSRDGIVAVCDNGILTVSVPTNDKEQSKMLEIPIQ